MKSNLEGSFNDIAWAARESGQSRGIIAGALDNGSLDLWDADELLNGNGLGSRQCRFIETDHCQGRLYVKDKKA